MDIEAIRKVQQDLATTSIAEKLGPTAFTLLSMLLSTIPVVGGALSIVSEQIKGKVYDPNYLEMIGTLARTIEAIEPDLAKLESIEARVSVLERIGANDALAATKLMEMFRALSEGTLDPIAVNSMGGTTSFTDVVIRDMHLHSVASQGGKTTIQNIDATGSAKFETLAGSEQSISNSTFTGRRPGFSSFVNLSDATIMPNTVVETAPADQNVGLRSVATSSGGEDVIGIHVSNGRVTFGGRPNRKA